jgi:hypothetical protein
VFTFFMGDKFFGVITAYVAGEDAERYHFTSALPVQIMRYLKPTLTPLLHGQSANAKLIDSIEMMPKDDIDTNEATDKLVPTAPPPPPKKVVLPLCRQKKRWQKTSQSPQSLINLIANRLHHLRLRYRLSLSL